MMSFSFPLQLESGQTIECTVGKYFYDKYRMQLKYPHLPCLQVFNLLSISLLFFYYRSVKSRSTLTCHQRSATSCQDRDVSRSWLTPKHLPWLRYFIHILLFSHKSHRFQATARSAPEREREISSLVRKAEFSADPFAHEFGIAINPAMTEVKGRVLSAPKLLYGGRTKATALPNQGVWDMRGKQFHTGIDVKVCPLSQFSPYHIL